MAGPQHVKSWFGRSAGAKDLDLVFERLSQISKSDIDYSVNGTSTNNKKPYMSRRGRRRRRRFARDKATYPVPIMPEIVNIEVDQGEKDT